MTKIEGWKIYHSSLKYSTKWEDEEGAKNYPFHGGLLLPICTYCGHTATRETYVGFWKEFFTLIQDYVITGIGKCPICLKWNAYVC